MLRRDCEVVPVKVVGIPLSELMRVYDVPYPRKIVEENLLSWGIVVDDKTDTLFSFNLTTAELLKMDYIPNIKEAMTTLRRG